MKSLESAVAAPPPDTDQIPTAESSPAADLPIGDILSEEPRSLDLLYDDILRATRWWVLYGSFGFAVFCILVGAVEALFGR